MKKNYYEMLSKANHDDWGSLSIQEKLSTLQAVEDRLAEASNRDSCKIIKSDLLDGEIGTMAKLLHGNEIHLSKKFFEDPIFRNAYITTIAAVIHEGRHAFQLSAAKGIAPHYSENDLDRWAAEFGSKGQLVEHKYQSTEADAMNFTYSAQSFIEQEIIKASGIVSKGLDSRDERKHLLSNIIEKAKTEHNQSAGKSERNELQEEKNKQR